ncbi:MAG TPA: 3-isopropylmalate dehydratase small subunit [Planctomycetaceae bacterium]|jgi:3-isopropylmalate/(R)-2-methylmalate dehydratase small subunit|nr:3-isopropylmalate dehydratase small subunit [Planctomycetaceae bacterium]
MQKIESITGTAIPLLLDDIDTDRIIPARYLRCVTFEGLGEHAFQDDRKQHPTTHPFDDARFEAASILVSGRNFGCGSSREHAPQALIRCGIKACIAESFAEIFFGNCTSLGVACVCVPRESLEQLAGAVERDPQLEVAVDLVGGVVRYGASSVPFRMPDGARKALVTGEFDFLGQLLEGEAEVRNTASKLPYVSNFA